MSSTAQHTLFSGGYGPADKPGLLAFAFDDETGAITHRGSFTGITNPSFLIIHPNGQRLYTVSEIGQNADGEYGAVWALRIDRRTVTLQPINQQSTLGDWPCHLEIDDSGRWLFASNYGTGDVAVFPILGDGSLGEMQEFVQHFGSGPNQARQESARAHSTTVTPDNRFAIIADLGIDQLVTYAFDMETGKLRKHAETATRPGAGPRHIAFHPDGRHLYVANELDSTVTVYDYDAQNGLLLEAQTLDTLPSGAPENIVADIHVSSSGQRVYVSNRGHNSVAVYEVEAGGRLNRLAVPSCGGKWPRNFTLAPGGRFVLVANEHSDEVAVLPVLAGAAELGAPVARVAVSRPTCLQWLR